MHIETWEEVINKNTTPGLNGLTVRCPICGREFGCNKTYHVYTTLLGRKRQYFCSFSCYKKDQIKKRQDERMFMKMKNMEKAIILSLILSGVGSGSAMALEWGLNNSGNYT